MRTALTIITTAILTAIAFLLARQNGWLGNVGSSSISCPTVSNTDTCLQGDDGASCTTPRGDTVAHGVAILSFVSDDVPSDETCESTTSICNDGVWLDDNIPHPYNTCTMEANLDIMQPCTVGDILVPHDSTNTFYLETRGENNAYIYQSQKRYCFDGDMDGDASYNRLNLISSCTLQVGEEIAAEDTDNTGEEEISAPANATITTTPVANIPDGLKYARCTGPFGGIRQHGKSAHVYLQASVGYGQSCIPTSVVCGYGTIRFGNADNIGNPVGQDMFAECIVGEPIGCTSACGDMDHGASVTTYSNSTLPYGGDESCEDVEIRSQCKNGSLSPQGGNACSCEVEPPATCTAPNGQIVAHDASLTLYQYAEVQAVAGDGSDTCIRQWRSCDNGTFYDYNGNVASFTFEYPTCTVLPPPEGGGEGGEGVPQE